MEGKKAVVFGATGVSGRAIIEHLDRQDGWEVVAVSRRAPDYETGAEIVSADLLDRSSVEAALGGTSDATHLFFCAYQEMGGDLQAQVVANLEMLRNAVEVLQTGSSGLEHVSLMQGGKAYGCHLGPFKTPGKESDARHMPPNFYYSQEDYLREESARQGWGWSALRPEAICGFAVGNPMNLVTVIAVWGTLCRELGLELSFPGKPGAFTALYQVTDARILAKAATWAAITEECAGEVFNITNGDYFRWQNIWPRFAEFFEVPVGGVLPMPLTTMMADKERLWDRTVEQHGLQPYSYSDIVSWGFGDAIFGSDYDNITSTIKCRSYGFNEFIDSEMMWLEILGELRSQRIIP